MKDNNLPIHDLSYYGLYLQRYLKEYHPDQVAVCLEAVIAVL